MRLHGKKWYKCDACGKELENAGVLTMSYKGPWKYYTSSVSYLLNINPKIYTRKDRHSVDVCMECYASIMDSFKKIGKD